MAAIKDALPIHITEEELGKYPQFAHLLTQLREKVTVTGVSHHMQRSLDLAQRNLSQARHDWLMKSVIYHELGEVLADLEVRGQEGTLTMDEKQFRHVLSKTLAYGEISDYLHFLPNVTSTSTLFGLSEGDVDRHNPVKHHLPAVQQTVVPMIEDRLRKKCEELYNYFDASSDQETASDRLLVAKSQSLPALIEKKQQDLTREKEAVKQIRARRDKQFWMYYQHLLQCLSIMETLIVDFKMKNQTEMDDISVAWLKAKCDALCLKVRLTKQRILCETYTIETCKALRKIGANLDSAIKQTERELASTSQSLQHYHAIGEEFKSLVSQFCQLQQEIENRKWGLFQLAKQTKPQFSNLDSDVADDEDDDEDEEELGAVGGVISSDSLEQASESIDKPESKRAGDEKARGGSKEQSGGRGGESTTVRGQGSFFKKESQKGSKTVTFNPLFDDEFEEVVDRSSQT